MALIESLKNYFGTSNVVAVKDRDDLFCCYKKSVGGIVYQIIYVDSSDAWLKAGREAYFEDILSENYYTSETYLQWNFYYYFIADEAIMVEHSDIVSDVENDEAFARKFILSEIQLFERFNLIRDIGRSGAQLDGADLYTEWLNYLRENELHFVYDEINYPNYKSSIEQFTEGKPFLSPAEIAVGAQTNAIPQISFLSRLDIDNFRPQPVVRNFEFGRVNLISGANATGKTSFFDIVEYCLTGKAKSSDGAGYRMRITTSDNLIIPYPDIPTTYRQRDISWYKNVNTRGHNLNSNFSKFNYFSSDAAFVLKTEDDRGENVIERTITDIAVGREINRLEERVTEFRSRFDAQLDTLQKTNRQLSKELEDLSQNAEEIQASSTDSSIFRGAVINYLDQYQWNVEIKEDEELIASIAGALELVNNTYRELVTSLSSSSMDTPAQIDMEIERLIELTNSLAKSRSELNNEQSLNNDLQLSIDQLTTIIKAAAGLQKYFQDSEFKLLPIIDEEVGRAETKVYLLQKAGDCLSSLTAFLSSQPPAIGQRKLLEYGQFQIDRRQQAQTDRQTAAILADTIRDSVDQLTKLVSDIKRLGSEYLEATPTSDHCPLCDTPMLHSILTERVMSTAVRLDNSEQYRLLQEEIRRYDRIVLDINRTLEEIDRLEKLIPHQYLNAMGDFQLERLKTFWEDEVAQLAEAREELSKLKGIRNRFVSEGLSYEYFGKVRQDLANMLNIVILDESDLQKALVLLKKQLALLNAQHKAQVKLINNIEANILTLSEPLNTDDATLAVNLRKWRAAKVAVANLRLIVRLDNDMSMSSVHTNAMGLTSVFVPYKDHWYAQKTRTDALELMTRSRQNVEERRRSNDAVMERVRRVIDQLDHLLNKRSKMQFLAEFVTANRQEIVGIFRQIHSPLEFEDISFDDNKVKLQDRDGHWHTINQVSTGQRTAVALSLFMSLNKKLFKGPNIIMMDDPVTYVDDLNTLSFFDYLRELVEQSDRQVFFATANSDIAFLFEKKFAYLGANDFKRFDFKRAD